MSILKVERLCKRYPAFELSDISFSLVKGQITGLIGRNGAGKSTLLGAMLGFIRPDAGEVSCFGKRYLDNEAQIKQNLGFVSGSISYYARQKLKKISGVTRSLYTNWDDNAYYAYMNLFGLDENKTPAKLSAGMRVKYAIVLALSHHAELLILDEPTSGLDPVSRDELREIFLDLRRQGKTILFSTHIVSDLEQCADRILYLKQGKLFADAALEDFVSGYRLVRFSEKEGLQQNKRYMLGTKREKTGYSALMKTQKATELDLQTSQADLETIIIHLEREGQKCDL